jgi:hypothetical protein
MSCVHLLQNRDTRSLNRAVCSCLSSLKKICLVLVPTVVVMVPALVLIVIVIVVVVLVQGIVPSRDLDANFRSEGI